MANRSTLSRLLGFVLTVAPLTSSVLGAPLAFPGVEGWGSKTKGGGQNEQTQVIAVTSLADSGPGTLREALRASGPRIVIFKTGGIITLKSSLGIHSGSITVAGQTAPGDGIIVKAFPIRIAASQVIMRGLRIRDGDGPGPAGDQRDSIQFGRAEGEPIRNVIVDHCSFGWSMDETAEFWYGCRDVTMSYCIMSEALWKSQHEKGSHGYALLVGNAPNEQISLHHNLFAHNERRNPWIKDNAQVEIVNNVVYNWGSEATGLWLGDPGKPVNPSFVDVIGNYYKPGEANAKQKNLKRFVGLGKLPPPGSKFYLHDNLGPGRMDEKQEDWDAAQVGDFDVASYRSKEPLPQAASGLVPQKATEAYERVLAQAGAVPRDKADTRAVEDTRSGGGKHIDNMEQLGGYPTYAPGSPPLDTDGDGIPDDWERAHGLNPNDKSDATKLAASGYLNIEEYINSLIPLPDSQPKR